MTDQTDEKGKDIVESNPKFKTVDDLIDLVIKDNQSHKAEQVYAKLPRDLEGPLFSFLVGAGFSITSGIPKTPILVEAMEKFLDPEVKYDSWKEILSTCSGEMKQDQSYRLTSRYFELMENLGGPLSRHAFLSSVIQWALDPKRQSEIGIENKLLAAILINGTRGEFDWNSSIDNPDTISSEWPRGSFAQHVFTTNFDDVIPLTFSQVFLPLEIVDGPALRELRMPAVYPTLAFLHGRYLHYDLRNTTAELMFTTSVYKDVFAQFRDVLRNTGLIVIGYSGAEDRVIKCIEETLNDQDSLRFGIWWSFHDDVNDLHPHVRKLIDSHPRAYYLCNKDDKGFFQGISAEDLMKQISARIGLNVSLVEDWWDSKQQSAYKRKEKIEKRKEEERSDPDKYLTMVGDAVAKGSRSDFATGLLTTWEKGMQVEISELRDTVIAGNIKRYVAILMLHNSSFKIGEGKKDDKNWIENGKTLIEDAIGIHEAEGDKYELARDYLHLGAYQSKRKIFEKDHFNAAKKADYRKESKRNLERAKDLFKESRKRKEVLSTELWLARLEIYLGDPKEGCKQLYALLPRAKTARFQSLVELIGRHIRRECWGK